MLAKIEVRPKAARDGSSDEDAENACASFISDRDGLYVMLVKAYFDESHQSREKFPASSFGAVVGTGLEWEGFTRDWLRLLSSPEYDVRDKKGRRVFHTSEFESPEGRLGAVYENWSEQKRNDFYSAMLGVIASNRIRSFASAVIAAEYDEIAAKRVSVTSGSDILELERYRLFGNRYAFCAYQTMKLVVLEARQYYPKGTQITYYFESGGDRVKGLIEDLYDAAMANSEQDYFKFYSAPHFGPKDSAVPLQAADKIAYEAAKEVSHICDLDPPERHSEMRDGRRQWRQRYGNVQLASLGATFDVRPWRKEDLETFFQSGEE